METNIPTTATLLVSHHASATNSMRKLSKCIVNAKFGVTKMILERLYSEVRDQYAPAWW